MKGDKKGCKDEDWLAWQLWRAQMAEQLLRVMNYRKQLGEDALPKAIDLCLRFYADDSISELAKMCHVGATSIRDWLNGKQKIHLETFLKICGLLELNPSRLLFQGRLMHSPVMPVSILGKVGKGSKFDLGLLEMKLVQMCFLDELPPPSLADVSRRIGHDSSHLRKLFPALCEEIVHRHSRFMRIQHERKIRALRGEVRLAKRMLKARGEIVTEQAVRQLLDKPGVLRHPRVREAL